MGKIEPPKRADEEIEMNRQDWGAQGDIICDPNNPDSWIKFKPDTSEVDLADKR